MDTIETAGAKRRRPACRSDGRRPVATRAAARVDCSA
jgi:hypothetical protein